VCVCVCVCVCVTELLSSDLQFVFRFNVSSEPYEMKSRWSLCNKS